ncbi:MAG: hypothetical protein IPN69_02935 [Acidobacteria bacterium]|nr:hypothetical protein [Acidobacteriota bacterium]
MKRMNFGFRRCGFIALLFLACGFGLNAEAFAAGVSISATPTTNSVFAGKKATYTISIWRTGYAGKVTLSAFGLPAGATATFSPNTTTANSSILTVQTQASTPPGSYSLLIKADAPNIVISGINLQLQVNPMPAVTVSAAPPNQSIIAGGATYTDISISRANFSGPVTLSAQNVPAGVTVQFDPPSTTGSVSRMLLLSNGLPFVSADYDIIVRGTSSLGVYGTATFQIRVNPGIVWADQFGAPNNAAFDPDFATDVVYDTAGNVYVTGFTRPEPTANFAETDAWVAKYNPSGTRLWIRTITNLANDTPTDVFVDGSGQVYIAGRTLVSNVNWEIFAAKYDANGNPIGSTRVFGTALEDGGGGMQFGLNASNVILTAATRVIRSAIQSDFVGNEVFRAEYDISRYTFDSNFNATSAVLVTAASGNPKDLAVGGDNSIFVLSDDRSQISQGDQLLISNSRVQKFLSPLNQNYTSAVIGPLTASSTLFFATKLKADANGNVVAIGNEYDRQIRVTDQSVPDNSWMVKLNSVGARLWETEVLSYYPTEIRALDIDSNGDVYIAGNTWDSLRGVNPNIGPPTDPAANTDAWFAKYAGAAGTQIFISQFNTGNKDGFNALKAGAANGLNTPLFFAGYTVLFKNVNYGYEDGLLLKCSTLYCGYRP